MRRLALVAPVALAWLGLGSPASVVAQAPAAPKSSSEVAVTGPTVVAFWLVPASDSVLAADPGLASALDEQQYHWAASRETLRAAGITPAERPGRRFCVREPERAWCFTAARDSAAVGYLLVRPGQPPRALYRVRQPAELLTEARAFFDSTGTRR